MLPLSILFLFFKDIESQSVFLFLLHILPITKDTTFVSRLIAGTWNASKASSSLSQTQNYSKILGSNSLTWSL